MITSLAPVAEWKGFVVMLYNGLYTTVVISDSIIISKR